VKKVKRQLIKAAAIMMVAAGGIVVAASPAQAAYSGCTIFTPWRSTCSTAAVAPNPDYHFIDWHVVSSTCSASYRVVDNGNGVWVASGTVPDGQTWNGSVYGLYSPAGYYLVVDSCYAGGGSVDGDF
jgi:hypothetical protein